MSATKQDIQKDIEALELLPVNHAGERRVAQILIRTLRTLEALTAPAKPVPIPVENCTFVQTLPREPQPETVTTHTMPHSGVGGFPAVKVEDIQREIAFAKQQAALFPEPTGEIFAKDRT